MTEEIKNSITETELTQNELDQVSGGKDNGGFTRKPRAKAGCQIYQIKHGDTLIKIAKRYGTTADHLMRINPELTNRSFIVSGCYIYVPA